MTRLLTLITALFLACPALAAEIGDDGLHKTGWMRDTFKDLPADLDEANAEGKRLMILVEQRGCIYCARMHENVFPRPEIDSYIRDNFFVVQMNLHGDTEITDFDGESLTEKQAVRKWGLLFTPSALFLPEEVSAGQSAADAAVALMPGAFEAGTTLDMLTWVNEKRYDLDGDEDFQRYHARRIKERGTPD
ncbi:thioredoxin family protein [Pukyongiella litopenaei]|uniref:Thioredoxin fold domain-containing protein n=1 Tax=Pukyongiella litopenaei TaxID=2605946 RepID=A0A2S0MMT4_9RHOB|nr:thioredoxin family protein [Pukyongiella litopenaei]AVO37137.1 thioredoxin fold domain-containing protein [Pukyongiella litopenaei]